jgi:hypothetical protein
LINACAAEEEPDPGSVVISRACIESLTLFSNMMVDNTKNIHNIFPEMTTDIAAYKPYMDMIDAADSSTTEAEYKKLVEGFPEYREGIASIFASGANKIRRVRRQVLLESPPVCASDLPPFPLYDNLEITNEDFIKFENDLQSMYEEWFNVVDATYGCYAETERVILASATIDEWFNENDVDVMETCRQVMEPAYKIYNEKVDPVYRFVDKIKGF